MEEIEYGYKDVNNEYHDSVDNEFADNYRLESPTEIEESKLGICWDQVEYERYLFDKQNIKNNTYFIVHYDNDKCPTHTFLIYEDNNKNYWFENAFEAQRGIHEFNTLDEAVEYVKSKQIEYTRMNHKDVSDKDMECLTVYEYTRPKENVNVEEYLNHVTLTKYEKGLIK
jgi:hypothetical protein